MKRERELPYGISWFCTSFISRVKRDRNVLNTKAREILDVYSWALAQWTFLSFGFCGLLFFGVDLLTTLNFFPKHAHNKSRLAFAQSHSKRITSATIFSTYLPSPS